MLKQFIEQLSRDLVLSESISSNEDGSYSLLLDSELEISLRENPESGITLFATLSDLPNEGTEEFLKYALSSNLLGRETGVGFLGLDKEGKKVTFTCFLPQQLTYKEFYEALDDFANYAESWRMEVSQFAKRPLKNAGR